jgi:coenzyme F420 hydrogenase subunit delta
MLKRIYEKPRLVFGCGNPLFGDDGFGAEVIRLLEAEYRLPSDVAYLDVGTAVRDILFDMLLSRKYPRQIIIVDAMALKDASPGEIREIGLDEIQPAKIVDYSLHQFPTTNMLKELRQHTDIDVRILVVNPADIPSEVHPGLSASVQAAVRPMCQWIMDILVPPSGTVAGGGGGNALMFRVGTLAAQLGVHRNTVTNWIKTGKLPARPTIGKKYLIQEEELERFCQDAGIEEDAWRAAMASGHHTVPGQAATPLTFSENKKEVSMSQSPIGAAMVVGGGIAAIQATLDLAESGYYVHMVEKTAGIGGVMAQLDKTYPTNDCAM